MRFALLTLCLVALPASGQEPPKSIDVLVGEAQAIKAARAELDKRDAANRAAIAAELKRINDLVAKLDDGPAPKPKPPEPKPADPLRDRLKAAFDADPEQLDKRRGHALDLAALYREAAKLSADPAVGTSGDLLARVRDAGRALVGADALREVRRAAGAELGALLPTDAPLTDEQRRAAAGLFTRLSAALEDVSK